MLLPVQKLWTGFMRDDRHRFSAGNSLFPMAAIARAQWLSTPQD
jgi:hypothetical protein